MGVSVASLEKYMDGRFNVLLTGESGTGKTMMTLAAADKLGLSVKYYSSATLDPYADLVGIPVPDQENKTTEFLRPRAIDAADVVFFDELNRARPEVRNAVLEIIQFRTINGEPLPNLKFAVAAINPENDHNYDTDRLDTAISDRFDVFMETTLQADYAYFKKKFGTDFAKAGITIFREYQESYQKNQKNMRPGQRTLGLFSPRRLEKLMDVYQRVPTEESVRIAVPNDVQLGVKHVKHQFDVALGYAQPKQQQSKSIDYMESVQRQLTMTAKELRSTHNYERFAATLDLAEQHDDAGSVNKLLNSAVEALSTQVGVGNLYSVWGNVVDKFTTKQRRQLVQGWRKSKYDQVIKMFGWSQL